MPLAAVGGGTSTEPVAEEGKLLVRFDLMRGVRLPHGDGGWVEAESGTPWLKLDEELRLRDMGLAVYPTSAPRATVGGWLATDGLGVGSFEYGWLRENVLSASVVLPGGERREVPGEEVGSFLSTGTAEGIVVDARLRTRQADADTPFAATFEGAADLERRGDRPVRYECSALAPGSPEPGHGARQKPRDHAPDVRSLPAGTDRGGRAQTSQRGRVQPGSTPPRGRCPPGVGREVLPDQTVHTSRPVSPASPANSPPLPSCPRSWSRWRTVLRASPYRAPSPAQVRSSS